MTTVPIALTFFAAQALAVQLVAPGPAIELRVQSVSVLPVLLEPQAAQLALRFREPSALDAALVPVLIGAPGGPISWIDYATASQYTGASATIASGEVLTASYNSGTIYRHITTAVNANGYPVEDAFYSGFDGTTLTGLLVARGA